MGASHKHLSEDKKKQNKGAPLSNPSVEIIIIKNCQPVLAILETWCHENVSLLPRFLEKTGLPVVKTVNNLAVLQCLLGVVSKCSLGCMCSRCSIQSTCLKDRRKRL